jgi:2,3-oxidosqualene cyclase
VSAEGLTSRGAAEGVTGLPRSPSPAARERGPGGEGAAARALRHLLSLQRADGCWEGEVVWNTMLLSQYVIVHRIVGSPPFAPVERARMIRHYEVTRTPEGGWGMHPDSGPYVFFTALAYVALRLLGVAPGDPLAARARAWLSAQPGGVRAVPTWGKVWLALAGLYGWEGVSPVPPELFLLPEALPFHPDRYYCHTRYIYLGIAYLYGRRFAGDLGPITGDLRRELHGAEAPYEAIDFAAHRHDLAATDLHVRPGLGLRLAYDAIRALEPAVPGALRRRALDHAARRIAYELEASRFQCISPVNGLLNVLCVFDRDPRSPLLAPALRGVEAWRWEDEAEGVRFAGARSNAWDTAFALRAAIAGLEGPRDEAAVAAIRRGYAYLRDTQMVEELPGRERERRDAIAGGWCFSDGQHRWPVSDCTAEALSAILLAHEAPGLVPEADRLSPERIRAAATFVLDRQNDDGGFGTYERRRGGALLEALNPSEMYGNCMTERSYLECTASSIGALARFVEHDDDRALRRRAERAVRRGAARIRRAQRPDGAWAGFWGVNFTYGTFHAVEGLRAAGAGADDPAISRAARWIAAKQKADGGWGEHHTGCLSETYEEHPESQVVMTSWAVLALAHAGQGRSEAVRRGVAFLEARQREDGSYPEEAVAGVFFGTAMLHYRLYKAYFPAWALARASARGLGPLAAPS